MYNQDRSPAVGDCVCVCVCRVKVIVTVWFSLWFWGLIELTRTAEGSD